jgi:glycosyltransferase involved in cell wall biosynthesis
MKRNLTNVTFIDEVPKSKMPRYWSLLDVSMVLLRRAPVFMTVIPSKIYESVAMGIPVVLGVEGEARSLVEELGIGLTIPPESVRSLVTAILRIKEEQDLALRLRKACLKASAKFDRQELAKAMLESLQETVAECSS